MAVDVEVAVDVEELLLLLLPQPAALSPTTNVAASAMNLVGLLGSGRTVMAELRL